MPELKICSKPGKLAPVPLALAGLRATMLFPKDQARREQCYAIEATNFLKNTRAPRQVDWPVVSALHDAAQERNFNKLIDKAQRSGETAGLLYRVLAQSILHEPHLASFNSALAVTAALIERMKLRGNENRGRASSASAIKDCWSSHRSVAHLCTAAKLAQDNKDTPGWDGDWRASEAGLLRMLALSEALRILGENHFPKGQTSPTLDPSQTWRVPNGLPLPDMAGLIPPLEAEIIDYIDKDRAIRRRSAG